MTSQEIKRKVANYFCMSPDQIDRPLRRTDILVPRQITHFLCCKFSTATLGIIGRDIGLKDHSTVIHSCHVVEDMITTRFKYSGESVRDIVDNISEMIVYSMGERSDKRIFRQLYDMKRNRYVSEKFLTA